MSRTKTGRYLITYERPFSFSQDDELAKPVLHLDREVIDKGLFRALPPFELLTYLLLLTWMDTDQIINISLSELHSLLGASEEEIYLALGNLEREGFLAITSNPLSINKSTGFQIRIIKLPRLASRMEPAKEEQEKCQEKGKGREKEEGLAGTENGQPGEEVDEEFLEAAIRQNSVGKSDLIQAMLALFQPARITYQLREELADWVNSFETPMIQELIRRTRKKMSNDPTISGLAYARGIVQNWYEEGITTYRELQAADKLYREIQELAAEYGLSYNFLKPPQKRILRSWMMDEGEESRALSKEVCKLAIQNAFREKRDGQPSLAYIEKNYIRPLKEAGARSPKEANRILHDRKGKGSKQKSKRQEQDYKWKDFFWDFDKFKEK
ncbi:MAG: DnaD domain protein [Halanaerobium sp.]|nr:DnaD domain protein [Halanaerobium sp.]